MTWHMLCGVCYSTSLPAEAFQLFDPIRIRIRLT